MRAAGQEGGGRHRRRREGAGPCDGLAAASRREDRRPRCRRRARRRDHPRASSGDQLPLPRASRRARSRLRWYERLGVLMIARLSGILAETAADSAVIDVGGVGYLVQLSGKTLGALGPDRRRGLLLTELQVREDAWTLFGFGSAARARRLPRAHLDPGRRRPPGARDPLGAFARRARPRRRAGRQGDDRPRQRRRPQARRAHRQ